MRSALLFLTVLLAMPAQLGTSQEIASTVRAESSTLSVHFRKGLLSVEARHISWSKLLAELSRQTGTILHINVPLEGTVTLSIMGFPLERALERLFGLEASFMFVYRERPKTKISSSLLSEVWVFGKGRVAETESNETVLSGAEGPDDELEREFERNPQSAHNAALRSADVEVRFKAVAYLGQKADQQAVNLLLELFHDPDPFIGRSALDAIGRLADSDLQVKKALTDLMEKTKDSDTRQLAADYLGISLNEEN
jgi:HEAT repeats